VTSRDRFLLRAAQNFDRAGQPALATQCLVEAGAGIAAAARLERLGEPSGAGDLYRAAGNAGQAARCYERANRLVDAAAQWLAAGEPDFAGWALVAAYRRTPTAELRDRALSLIARSGAGAGGLVRQLGIAMCASIPEAHAAAERAVEQAAAALPAWPAVQQRWTAERLVAACDLIGRFDLSATVFAACHRAGLASTPARWQAWALTRLGGSDDVPTVPYHSEVR
jgi:tetratricopeptide (TPR) repeat protein